MASRETVEKLEEMAKEYFLKSQESAAALVDLQNRLKKLVAKHDGAYSQEQRNLEAEIWNANRIHLGNVQGMQRCLTEADHRRCEKHNKELIKSWKAEVKNA